MLSKTILAALLAAPAALAAPLASRAETTPLHISLEAPDDVADLNGATVTAIIKNTGSEAVTIVNDPNSAVSTWKTNTFKVAGADGTAAKFSGYVVKSDLTKVTRTTIEAGKSVTVEHTLGGVYDLATSGAGKFSVEPLSKVLTVVDSEGNLKQVEATIETEKSSFKLADVTTALKTEISQFAKSGEAAVKALTGSIGLTKKSEFPSCSSDQQGEIEKAIPAAQDYVKDALDQLSSSSSDSPGDRYTTWFGEWSEERHSKVSDHFNNLDKQDWDSFTFDCGCDEQGTWAYVQPDDFGVIHLCLEFWEHDVVDVQDSKAGTLIHESTHFTKNGGTDDVTYQPSGCKELASSDPDQAVSSADNHEYFCESRGGVVTK